MPDEVEENTMSDDHNAPAGPDLTQGVALTDLKDGKLAGHVGDSEALLVKVEDDNTLLVEIAKDIRVRVARGTISELLNKPAATKGPAQASAGSSSESGATKPGLMSQLFGKK